MSAEKETLAPIAIGSRGIVLQTHDELWRFSTAVAKSGLAPKGIQTPEAILTAIQMGMEVGLTPMASLQNIAVINGRPSIWGDAQLGLIRQSGILEEFAEWYEVGGKRVERAPSQFADDVTAVCRVKRKGEAPMESAFSVADAKLAGLWKKEGPWTNYPARMLRFRARSFALRDQFGDVLKGLRSVEEVRDFGEALNVTPGEEGAAAPKPRLTRRREEPTVEVTVEPVKPTEPAPAPEPPKAAEPAAEPAPAAAEPDGDPTEKLAAIVKGVGAGLSTLRDAMKETGWFDPSGWEDWDKIPKEDADRLAHAKHGLVRALRNQLRKEKGEA